MISAVALLPRISHEDYLDRETISPVKHEYVAGRMYAMTGISDVHNLIAGNIYSLLRNHLKGTPCQVFMADVKAKLAEADAFYYPDVMVSCETPLHPYYRQQPKLIVEVLSPTTARHDRGKKRINYQTLESLQDYILVSHDCMDVRVWRRGDSGWSMTIYTDGMTVPLASIAQEIPIEAIYEDVFEG